MTSNLYKVGDWVYCEVSPFQPYVIRKIEELTKTPNGNVEAKVICAYRYHDIPVSVMATVEKYKNENKPTASDSQTNTTTATTKQEDQKPDSNASSGTAAAEGSKTTTDNYYEEAEVADLNEQQRYNLRHRELFFSKCTDTIAATTIRAKCSVLLFNEEIEKYSEYLGKEDQFYYHLTYDPYAKSLVADKGEIRVGMKYQAEVPALKVLPNGTLVEEPVNNPDAGNTPTNDRVLRSQRGQQHQQLVEIPISQQTDEILNWLPIGSGKNLLADSDIDKYLTVAKSIGTFARALDCNNAFKNPSLPISAAFASREITLFHAMNALHDNNYDIGKAVLSLITSTGPVLCRDELEEWSAVEANLFEDALEKYGKEFAEIRKDYLPWKSMKSIIEYYYTWKTTDRYLQQKRIKLNEQESKLKQVYIPNHSKQNQSALIKTSHVQMFQQYDVHLRNSCESCGAPNTSTNQWYAYTPTTLVQLIMTGQTGNQAALLQAHAQALAQLASSSSSAQQPSTSIYQQRLCADCWSYWKKFSAFKFANAKQERLNQLKNQVHKCAVVGCGREFKMKQLLAKHCAVAHGYFTKANLPPGQQQQQAGSSRMPVRNRTAFHLLTTPMTRAARVVCPQIVRVKKLARRPFKLVDLGELNREWFKSDAQPRNITDILSARAAKRFDRLGKIKLDVKLINRIHRAARRLSNKQSGKKSGAKVTNGGTNGTNGHQDGEVEMVDGEAAADDDEDDDAQLVIDYDNQEDRPEFLKYFENKSANTPSFTPDRIAFPKPSSDQINKFHLNLMSQIRKRPLEGGAESGQAATGSTSGANQRGQNGASDTENVPATKRTLLANPNQSKQQSAAVAGKPTTTSGTRLPQKSHRPTASSNLPNSPEDIFYLAVPSIKTLRREVEVLTIRRLARKPYRLLNADQHTKLYSTLEKIAKESLAKYQPSKSSNKLTNGCETSTTTTANKEGENEAAASAANDEKSSGEVNGTTTHASGSVVVLD